MLASMQQWMIGLGIMVAVSGFHPLIIVILVSLRFSNGSDMDVPTIPMTLPGDFPSHYKQRQL